MSTQQQHVSIHDLHSTPSSPRARSSPAGASIPPPPRRWTTRVLLPTALLVVTAGLFAAVGRDSLRPRTPVRVAPVVARVGLVNTGEETVLASGWLEPDPFPTYAASLVAGVVSEVLVLEGDAVVAGQVVARLIDDEAQLAVQQARAELELAQAQLEVAEVDYAAAVEANRLLIDRRRDVARQGARLARIEASQQELQAQIAAQANEVAARADQHRRALGLLAEETTNEGEVTQLGLRLEAARDSLEALKRRAVVLEAELAEAQADEQAATRHLETLIEERQQEAVAKARVAQQQAQLAGARARLAEAELALYRHDVRALAPGIVMLRLAAPGARLMLQGDNPHGSHVVHTYRPDELQVRVDVPLADAGKIGLGQEALVEVETLPGRSFAGVVERVVHQADVQKNTVEFKVTLDAPAAALKPDMLARIRFLAAPNPDRAGADGERPEALFLPQAALVGQTSGQAGTQSTVWVVRDRRGAQAEAQLRAVTLGGLDPETDAVEVRSGLLPGDEVVVSPPPGMSAGDLLVVQGEAP